jgi:hypothetical protein
MHKRSKIEGSGRKQGSQNILQRELRERLTSHLVHELTAIHARLDELPLVDRYKVAAMLFKLVVAPESQSYAPPPVIHVYHDL